MSRSITKGIHLLAKPAFQPLVTGPLLYILLRGPESLREPLVKALSSLPVRITPERAITILKWLVALGAWGRLNSWLNSLALNAWQIRSRKADWNWNQEVAVVTGGCSGIGEVVVNGLTQKGVKVAVLDIQPLPASLKDYANLQLYKCDITNAASVTETGKAIREKWGPPSILVNNAGIGSGRNILDIPDESLHKIFGVNLLSHFTTVKEFMPDMIEKNKGHIVAVASLASFVAVPGIADYAATKAGVLAFHEALNQEIKHRYNTPGILTTIIHPNWTSTPLIRKWEDQIRKASGPLLKAEDVGNSIVNQIFQCRGAQIIIPRNAALISGIRGWPNWMQEKLRDGIGRVRVKYRPSEG
ncbi:NAD(P)-binding protein [Rhizodiscina lignyota]|uniref:Short-chain dehydrogenase/reductase 3 n=1 Tax=Rhizodiscina lignyota TaxID=1504668 RepID=A0A9P4IBZ4_9PEZI|nr:NAD(P)-binding protein [Rhizodiscina lignyota]